jgi:hypothetical protein
MEVFPLLLFPPLDYLQELKKAEAPVIDLGEHFIKQTWRNRYKVLGPNKLQTMTIEVKGQKGIKTPILDIELAQEAKLKKHVRTMDTAYNASAFYEHYRDEIVDILHPEKEKLSEISKDALLFLCEQFEIEAPRFSELYIEKDLEGIQADFREHLFGKTHGEHYHQVYQDRHGFVPGLSGIDALFNLGNTALSLI